MKYTKSSLKRLIKEAIVEKQIISIMNEIKTRQEKIEETMAGLSGTEAAEELTLTADTYAKRSDELQQQIKQLMAAGKFAEAMQPVKDLRELTTEWGKQLEKRALSQQYGQAVREDATKKKVTKSSLKTIIEEELQKLLEWPDLGGEDPHFDEQPKEEHEIVDIEAMSGPEGFGLARSNMKEELMFILNKWEMGRYDSDEHRWKEYAADISDLANSLESNEPDHEGECDEAHPGMEHQEWEDYQGE